MAEAIRLIIPWGRVNRLTRKMNALAPIANPRIRSLALEGLNRLKSTTPRSEGGEQHIADMWKDTYRTVGGLIREVQIKNDPRNELVLMCLETGTKPHRIPSSGNRVLHFMVGGAEVWAMNVMHKGSRAFRMVELTRQAMNVRLTSTLRLILRDYAMRVTRG